MQQPVVIDEIFYHSPAIIRAHDESHLYHRDNGLTVAEHRQYTAVFPPGIVAAPVPTHRAAPITDPIDLFSSNALDAPPGAEINNWQSTIECRFIRLFNAYIKTYHGVEGEYPRIPPPAILPSAGSARKRPRRASVTHPKYPGAAIIFNAGLSLSQKVTQLDLLNLEALQIARTQVSRAKRNKSAAAAATEKRRHGVASRRSGKYGESKFTGVALRSPHVRGEGARSPPDINNIIIRRYELEPALFPESAPSVRNE